MRHRAVGLALIVAGAGLGTGTRADPAKSDPGLPAFNAPAANISPVFHQLVVFTLPPHFRAAFERTNAGFYIREQVPEGESVGNWTRMITLTGARDLATNPNATPQLLVERMTAGFRRNCPDTFSSAVLGPQTVDGFAGFEAIASCGHQQSAAGAYSETAIMLAVKGSGDYYTLQWAERAADSKGPLSLDTAYWTRQFDQLRPIRLCAIVQGEAPPYPSCFGGGARAGNR
jgi:hypothetical protein